MVGDGERLARVENAAWSTAFAYVSGRQDALNERGITPGLPILAASEFAVVWARRHRALAEQGIETHIYVKDIKQHFDAWLSSHADNTEN